ncbi:trypsin-like peptidase domain-containing protein [Gandjariella thermophila]|uniref:Serine protease n=1 Tax=Gandjariella thermophila TaxID=1931992 RepID=A0A4D4J4J6_9PSEU|nr:trypsin-like peptidase domain-containing protein [Gandjariella thermophila]GDY29992.1 serine protease [Gandjariella thermophila]
MSQQPNRSPDQPGPDANGAETGGDATSRQWRDAAAAGAPASGGENGRPRLGPRPLHRPPVDPGQAAVFGRPDGVSGAFAPRTAEQDAERRHGPVAPPPADALVQAFGRPPGQDGVVLQRPPGGHAEAEGTEPAFWTADDGRDPWRDPGAGAVLGPPALDAERGERASPPESPGPLLSVPELLFGRRVKPTALLALFAAALLVGAVGGLIGWGMTKAGGGLTDSSVTINQVSSAKDRPPGSVAAIARQVSPAVVSIEVRAGQGGDIGSGVVIDGKGYVLTNNHVLSAAARDPNASIQAVFTDGTRAPAAIVGRDPKTDLAVIKVAVSNPVVVKLGRSADLAVGDTVIAIGSPLGLASTVTEGIVSAVNRPLMVPGEGGDPPVAYDAIQTDAAINPGNSGGALVDTTGALVGINSLIKTFNSGESGGGSIGLGFAIPVDQAARIAQGLIRDGQVKHADLGVNAKSVSANTSDGAQVQNVQAGGAAAQAGVVEGDVITKVGDRPIRNAEELVVVVREHNIGETVPVQVVRQGRQLTLQVSLHSD